MSIIKYPEYKTDRLYPVIFTKENPEFHSELKGSLAECPAVRADKVRRIKHLMQKNLYKVSAPETADKIINDIILFKTINAAKEV